MDETFLQCYSAMGWALFPCSNQTKKPLTSHGLKDATTDMAMLLSWSAQHSGCAWGFGTSASVGVLDIDPKNGGDVSFAALVAKHGALPHTPRVRSGGGGHHYYFKFPTGTGCNQNVIAEGVDRRADGGYIIIPPSRIDCREHNGRAYTW